MTFLQWSVVIFAVANVGYVFCGKRNALSFAKTIWGRFRVVMFLECVFLTAVVVTVSGLLMRYVPGMSYGWMSLVFDKGGNMLFAPALAANTSSSVIEKLIPVGFLAVTLIAVPYMARIEEEVFRDGRLHWREILPASFLFGIFHCLVGVPLGVGLTLTIAGLFFGWKYRSAFLKAIVTQESANATAILECTAYHSMYNTIIVFLLLLVSVMMVFA